MQINTNNNQTRTVGTLTITVPNHCTDRDVEDMVAVMSSGDLEDRLIRDSTYEFRPGWFEIRWVGPNHVHLSDVEDC